MNKTRNELLGSVIKFDVMSFYRVRMEWYRGPGKYDVRLDGSGLRKDDIHTALCFAVMRHLGFQPPCDVKQLMNAGIDIALDYFLGDWWKADKRAGPYVNKDSPLFDASWYEPFSEGLLLGLLCERWDDVAGLCSWVEPRIWKLGDNYELGAQLYMSIAASLRPEPMPGIERLEAGVEKWRLKKQKLLFKAWFAARDRDQGAFDKAIKESLAHYEKNYASEFETVAEAIGLDQSTIVLTAMRLGLNFPKGLTERQTALLITRESIEPEPK